MYEQDFVPLTSTSDRVHLWWNGHEEADCWGPGAVGSQIGWFGGAGVGGPGPGPGPWARSGLEKGSDYGLFEKCQDENLQFFMAKKTR